MKTAKTSTRLVTAVVFALLTIVTTTGCRFHRESNRGFYNVADQRTSAIDPDEKTIRLDYRLWNGHAALESEHMVVVFHDVPPEQAEWLGFNHSGSMTTIPVSGSGVTTHTVSAGSNNVSIEFKSAYANGTNTLSLGKQSVRLVDSGTRLLAGDQSIDLSEGRKVIHLNGDAVSVE